MRGFQTFGCTERHCLFLGADGIIKGKTLDQALQITNHDIADFLGGLPKAKMHCSVMGQEALEAAIYKYRGIEVEIHHDDDDEGAPLVCKCFGITEPKIKARHTAAAPLVLLSLLPLLLILLRNDLDHRGASHQLR